MFRSQRIVGLNNEMWPAYIQIDGEQISKENKEFASVLKYETKMDGSCQYET